MTDIKQIIDKALSDDSKNTIAILKEYINTFNDNALSLVDRLSKLNYNYVINQDTIKIDFNPLEFIISNYKDDRMKLTAYKGNRQIDYGSTTHNIDTVINAMHRIIMLHAILNEFDFYVYHTDNKTHVYISIESIPINFCMHDDGKLDVAFNVKRSMSARDPNGKKTLNSIIEFFKGIQ